MTNTDQRLTADLKSLGEGYCPTDHVANLADQVDAQHRKQKTRQRIGALAAAAVVSVLIAGGVHTVIQTQRNSKVSVQPAQGHKTTKSAPARTPSPKSSARAVKLVDGQPYTVPDNIKPMQDSSVPVVDLTDKKPAEVLLALADRVAQRPAAEKRPGFHIRSTTLSMPGPADASGTIRQGWVSASSGSFGDMTGPAKPVTVTASEIHTKGLKFTLTKYQSYGVDRYEASNGDGKVWLSRFKAGHEHTDDSHVLGLMFKEVGHDISMPISGLGQASILRAFATLEGLRLGQVSKDHFGRDVLWLDLADDQAPNGLVVSARTGELWGMFRGEGKDARQDYVFHHYVPAAP